MSQNPYYPSGVSMPGEPMAPGPDARAVVHQPNIQQMGGPAPVSWVRVPFFPTAPFYSTSGQVGYQTRYYSGGLLNGTINTESVQIVQFDLPCRLIALNGAAVTTDGSGLPVGRSSLDTFLFRLEYTTGDRLHITQRLASTVLGTAQRPGELGGAGYTINQGASVQLGITPLMANLRIDVTLVCLEMRGPSNFTSGR